MTRKPFRNEGRQRDLILSGKFLDDLDEPPLNPVTDREMIYGSPAMLKEISSMLHGFGIQISPHAGGAGDCVIKRPFVEQ